MPDTVTNGYTNGHGHMPYDMENGSSFLFTSESVGEGHPGKWLFCFKAGGVTTCRYDSSYRHVDCFGSGAPGTRALTTSNLKKTTAIS